MDQTKKLIIYGYKKANTNTSPEMKISCNVKQGTYLVKNTSQTVKIKNKTDEKAFLSDPSNLWLHIFCSRSHI